MNALAPTLGLLTVSLTALGCTPSHLQVRGAPADALAAATARLEARNIPRDPAGHRADRLRTAAFCYHPPRRDGGGWDASFADPSPGGPVGFSHTAPLDALDEAAERCRHLFRLTLSVQPAEGATRLVVESEWWRVVRGRCRPAGDPLTGVYACAYTYRAEHDPPGDVEGWVYRLLVGL